MNILISAKRLESILISVACRFQRRAMYNTVSRVHSTSVRGVCCDILAAKYVGNKNEKSLKPSSCSLPPRARFNNCFYCFCFALLLLFPRSPLMNSEIGSPPSRAATNQEIGAAVYYGKSHKHMYTCKYISMYVYTCVCVRI